MKSLWVEDSNQTTYHNILNGDIHTDTVIVGGGLAGILCSFLLKERGVDHVVVEAEYIGSGVTQNTTAKITAQHGLVYSDIEKRYGLEAAKKYLNANLEALKEYRRLTRSIDCDFEERNAYVYSLDNPQKLKREMDLYQKMGMEPIFLEKPSIPLNTVGAIGMANQAQFHPLKFLKGIAKNLPIYENTFVTEIEPDKVITKRGNIHARRIVLATHFPMVNIRGLYFMKLYQHRSYVLALKEAPDPGGMYIDEQQGGLSFRTYGEYLLLGGGSHKTGHRGGGWDVLRSFAHEAYPSATEAFRWATQDCMSLDSMPYIGRHSRNKRELYVATGFHKWGMTGSMVAARLLCEQITEGNSPYTELFSPSRSLLHPQLFTNIGQSVLGLVSFGKRCSHMGCALKWNPRERTWDCPCHGSRFDRDGKLIDNPAKRGIDIG